VELKSDLPGSVSEDWNCCESQTRDPPPLHRSRIAEFLTAIFKCPK